MYRPIKILVIIIQLTCSCLDDAQIIEEQGEVYRQTYYSVAEGETQVGAGFTYQDKEIQVIDNVMHYNDDEFGLIPIIAIDINQVRESGLNEKGTWNIYGSVVELKYPDSTVNNAIILDACGMCAKDERIDLWVYNNDARHDINNVEMTLIRKGWSQEGETIHGTN